MAYRSVKRFSDTHFATIIAFLRLASQPTYTMPNPHPNYFQCTRFNKVFKYVGI